MDLRIVNGLSGDPAVYGFFPASGDAVLFDAGDLRALTTRELLKVRLLLVSHTHIDHFIGFDQLLRVNIPHFRTLEVCGPPGIVQNVAGKLQGYHWNLLEPEQLRILVRELDTQGRLQSFILSNTNGFVPVPTDNPVPQLTALDEPLPLPPARCVAVLADGTRFEAVALDHGTPSLAYVCKSPMRLQVREEALEEMGLKPGAWIKELQWAFAQGQLQLLFEIEGQTPQLEFSTPWTVQTLGERLFTVKAAKPVAYVTDIGFTKKNLEMAASLFRGVEKLICETNFKDADYLRAREKMHLTTRQAALIGSLAGAHQLEVFHISNIYADDPKVVQDEAYTLFSEYQSCSVADLWMAAETEFSR